VQEFVLRQALLFLEGSMHATPINAVQVFREASPAIIPASPTPAHADAESVVEYLVHRDVVTPGSQAASHVRTIFAAPPDTLRVAQIARRTYWSRRTLGRQFKTAGLPAPVDWVALARAVRAHRSIARGALMREAAASAGYRDQFTMSNAIHRITGLRPSKLRDVHWTELLNVWIARQRERGALTGPPAPEVPTCPLCGTLRAC
jgi:AraC-like DNA-binding protein